MWINFENLKTREKIKKGSTPLFAPRGPMRKERSEEEKEERKGVNDGLEEMEK